MHSKECTSKIEQRRCAKEHCLGATCRYPIVYQIYKEFIMVNTSVVACFMSLFVPFSVHPILPLRSSKTMEVFNTFHLTNGWDGASRHQLLKPLGPAQLFCYNFEWSWASGGIVFGKGKTTPKSVFSVPFRYRHHLRGVTDSEFMYAFFETCSFWSFAESAIVLFFKHIILTHMHRWTRLTSLSDVLVRFTVFFFGVDRFFSIEDFSMSMKQIDRFFSMSSFKHVRFAAGG